jgi:hypothetical protein
MGNGFPKSVLGVEAMVFGTGSAFSGIKMGVGVRDTLIITPRSTPAAPAPAKLRICTGVNAAWNERAIRCRQVGR